MASLDTLPPDQRAVLQMVLSRGRGYDEIAKMLRIDSDTVRDRALAALEALGPETRVPADRRAMITDYLLGQLHDDGNDEMRESLARLPTERAWARVVASELQPLASSPLPEIPAAAQDGDGDDARPPSSEPEAPVTPAPAAGEAADEPSPAKPSAVGAPISRRGGAILLGLGAAVVIGVVVFLIVNGSGGKSHHASTTPAASTPTGTPTSSCNPATSTTACPIQQINLRSPSSSSTIGIAEVLKKGNTTAIAIVAQGVPANTKHNAYAVWLANSSSDAVRLGFVNPGVGKSGRLQTAGPLPGNASHFKQLLVTVETQPNPRSPGTILLQGPFTEG